MMNPSSTGRFASRLSPTKLASGAVHSLRKTVHDLWPQRDPGISALQSILKSADGAAPSRQADGAGELELPFDFQAATQFRLNNVHHSVCIERRKQAMVGLGHVISEEGQKAEQQQSNAALTLDPLSRVSWQTTLTQLAEDYVSVGNAYLEVVRRAPNNPRSPITGIHYVPASTVRLVLEDDRGINRHFRVLSGTANSSRSSDLVMAQFGDLDDFVRRIGAEDVQGVTGGDLVGGFSEIIHIPQPSTGLDRWYGFPDWLAATGYVELTQAVLQSQFDLFSNRGVPEFLLFLLGGRVDDTTWSEMTAAFDSYVGFGNTHKSSLFNLPDPELTIQLERLALEGIANGTFFKDMMETLSTTIVSAHGVPPALAGILIPGKMGAANELANVVMGFQLLVIGPAQHHIQNILGCTLGNSRYNQGLKIPSLPESEGASPDAGRLLRFSDFKFNTTVLMMAEIMEALKPVDTMGRMRDQVPEAAARGRDLDDGLVRDGRKEPTDERVAKFFEDPELVGGVLAAAAEMQARRNGSD